MLQPSLSFTSFYFYVLLKRGPFVYVVFKDSLETKILERANQKISIIINKWTISCWLHNSMF